MATAARALVVGINSYKTFPLSVCVHDAIEITAALQMPEYNFSVSSLLEDSATRNGIRTHLMDLFQEVAESYLFYFSGHGLKGRLSTYLASYDTSFEESDEGFDIDELRRMVEKLAPPTSSVVLILDCCHSGAAAAKGAIPSISSTEPGDLVRTIPALPSGRALLAACRDGQIAYEDSELGHGYFTWHLLQGLMGEAADEYGNVTVLALHDYIARQLKSQNIQTPVFKGDISGQMILGRGFPSKHRQPVTDDKLIETEAQAHHHLSDYQASTAELFNFKSLDLWKADGFRTACQLLEPILRWFEKQATQYPALSARIGFAKERHSATARLATLSSLEAGIVLNEGMVERKLGSGTFGTLWEVVGESPRPVLAYKVYHAHELDITEKVHRFRRGFEAMQLLDHPHIVKVQKFTDCPLGFYMSYIDGPNLRDFTGTIDDPVQILSILIVVAETLHHAHGRSVVHRDVKPENIVMSYSAEKSQWHPYLTDFDLAWFSTASLLSKEALGTWQYSAPEQYTAPGSPSARAPSTDAYSFGQLCFYAVTGSDPIGLDLANNRLALEKQVRGGWSADAAEEFIRLYSESTSRDPGKRPDFNAIRERLFRISELLRDLRPTKKLTPEKFLKELVFSFAGLSAESRISDNSFLTLSLMTRITVTTVRERHDTIDCLFDIEAQAEPVVGGAKNFEQVRRILMGRIEAALGEFKGSHKHHGPTAPFGIGIMLQDVRLNLEGISLSRRLITRIADIIEGK